MCTFLQYPVPNSVSPELRGSFKFLVGNKPPENLTGDLTVPVSVSVRVGLGDARVCATYLLVESHLKLLGILVDSYLSCMYRSTARARARCMHGTGSSTIKYVDLDLGSHLVVPDSLPALPYASPRAVQGYSGP